MIDTIPPIEPEKDQKACVRYTIKQGTTPGSCEVKKEGTCQVIQ